MRVLHIPHICVLAALLSSCAAAAAQTPGPQNPGTQNPEPQNPEPPKDSLGRETPRGTVVGFMAEARRGSDETALLYLDTNQRNAAGLTLVRELYLVLDRRLSARVAQLSDRPDGSRSNPIRPDEDVVGTIHTESGPFDLILERVHHSGGPPIWLFSRATLSEIPRVYAEVDLVAVERYVPDTLTKPRIFGIRLFEWMVFLLVLPLVYYLIGWIDPLLTRTVNLVRRRRAGAPMQHVLPGPVRLFLFAIAIRWILSSLELPFVERRFWFTISAMLAVIALVWLLLWLTSAIERYLHRHFRRVNTGDVTALLRLGRRMADVLVVAAGVLVVLYYFNVDPTAALAGLGIGGIAVALAAQKTLENVIGGLSIVFDNAVRVGDFLRLGDTLGTVDSIGLRSTRIRTLDRTILTVPNGQIANVNIETLSSRDKFWFHHFIPLRHETTSVQMRRVIDDLRGLLAGHSSIDPEVIRVRFFRLGPFSLDIELFAYIIAADWERFLELQQELLLRTMEIVEQSGLAIALPAQSLQLADAGAARPRRAAVPAQR